jgi:hypothetical protein
VEGSEDSTTIAQIAYEASIRELASQESQLDGLHARASFLLAAAGIATGTVLGRTSGSLNGVGLGAVIAFGMTAVLATTILAPRRESWEFTPSAQIILDTAREHELAPEGALEWLASAQHAAYTKNKGRLKDLYTLLTCGCFALIIAICLAVVSLGI